MTLIAALKQRQVYLSDAAHCYYGMVSLTWLPYNAIVGCERMLVIEIIFKDLLSLFVFVNITKIFPIILTNLFIPSNMYWYIPNT